MKPFKDFSAVEFSQDDSFQLWVKYPERDVRNTEFWNRFVIENPRKSEDIEEARSLILSVVYEPTSQGSEEEKRHLWNRIEHSMHEVSEAPVEQTTSRYRIVYRVAAVITGLLITSLAVWNYVPGAKDSNQITFTRAAFLKEINNSDSPKKILLADGTSITLEPRSSLQYPENFEDNFREVKLEGEAFFDVAKDRRRPFLVYSDKLVTKVLGTSFTIRAFQHEKDFLVKVKTGKVSVYTASDLEANKAKTDSQLSGTLLTPNQQVVFSRSAQTITKSLVESPSIVNPSANYDFEYKDAPLRDVFGELKTAYGIDIVYDEEVMGDCRLNASLNDMALYDKMRLICKGVNASYELLDSRIVVSGKGCQEHGE